MPIQMNPLSIYVGSILVMCTSAKLREWVCGVWSVECGVWGVGCHNPKDYRSSSGAADPRFSAAYLTDLLEG